MMPMTVTTMLDVVIQPFADYAFMRRALAACVILTLGGTPLGVFMTLRRMTLVGDAMSHAILPGVALAFAGFGLTLLPMTIGGLLTGAIVAGLAVFLSRYTSIKDDSALTLLYLLSMATGVTILSFKGGNIDLLHMLFGNILAIDNNALKLVAAVSMATVFTLAFFYRSFVIESFDSDFANTGARTRHGTSAIFFLLLVLNLIAAFQALGTLMALGLIILPSIAARFWTQNIDVVIPVSIVLGLIAAPVGLLISFYIKIPSGSAVVLVAGMISLLSVMLGRHGSLRATLTHKT
jgi:zinc/manganese transport system permease protein